MSLFGPVFRIEPNGRPEDYKTFALQRTHGPEKRRPATCEEVGCPNYLNGWKTIVPRNSDLEALVRRSGKSYSFRVTAENLIEFIFEPGQQCFAVSTHTIIPGERPFLFVVKEGDHRGNPRGTAPRVLRGEDWVEEFATHSEKIREQIERG